MNAITTESSTPFDEVRRMMTSRLGGIALDWREKSRPDGTYLIFEVANPTTRFFSIIDEINSSLAEDHPVKDKLIVSKRKSKPANRLETPETKLFRREISESLTVDNNTFGDQFFDRYMRSVSKHEDTIVSKANCVVYGRRGAGKSSLLAYAMHQQRTEGQDHAWIAMQGFAGRSDIQAIAAVILEIFQSSSAFQKKDITQFSETIAVLQELSESGINSKKAGEKLQRLTPRIRRIFGSITSPEKPFTIFLDDIHLIGYHLQPQLLGFLYSVSRGNSVYIKASGIEQLCNLWDATHQIGLQTPHDAQILRLDYNLTMPDKSLEHIEGILDAHARYCGLPSVRYLIEDAAISRLVLVAAAVPRDALSLFSQGIAKALIKSQKSVSVTAINSAASEAAQAKMREIETDVPNDHSDINDMLEKIKTFCIKEKKKNSFLLKISGGDAGYSLVQKLVALRLIHTLHEGITPHQAGERFQALMLDFGFYVGIRAAKSVVIFPSEPKQLLAKDLRRLPIFTP